MMVGKTESFFLAFPGELETPDSIFLLAMRGPLRPQLEGGCVSSSARAGASFVKISGFVNAGEDVVPDAYESTQHLGVLHN